MITGWNEIAGDWIQDKKKYQVICWNQNLSISTLKKLVPDEKDTAIESDSTQKMMSCWNWAESGTSSTNPEVETPLWVPRYELWPPT